VGRWPGRPERFAFNNLTSPHFAKAKFPSPRIGEGDHKEYAIMKFKELTTKSENEVTSLLLELKTKAHDLAVKIRLNQLKNTHELKVVKKDIARIMTYVHNLKK
jgi:large subunit ribosomal protein L29